MNMHAPGRPSKFTQEQRDAIVKEWIVGNETLSGVAVRHSIKASLLYNWVMKYKLINPNWKELRTENA